jgi:hypothetical protein
MHLDHALLGGGRDALHLAGETLPRAPQMDPRAQPWCTKADRA